MTMRSVTIPADTWPPRMQADMAAGYCGEKQTRAFLDRVGREYPLPRVTDSAKRKFWYRADLDRAMAITPDETITGMGGKFRDKIKAANNNTDRPARLAG